MTDEEYNSRLEEINAKDCSEEQKSLLRGLLDARRNRPKRTADEAYAQMESMNKKESVHNR
jgi:hypothetical protein